ncbi:MAG: MgtC/SapB family protein [Thermodesulfobacteria bacterium]|nr:MgtC/SapB family protein [Thermodesulfobacteriota bacterium]
MDIHIIRSILIAAALGFMIGMQRSIYHLSEDEKSFGGSRTFSIIALAGYMAGMLNREIAGIAIAAALIIGLIIMEAYYFKVSRSMKGQGTIDLGSTTHFAAMATFLLGLLVSLKQENLAVFVGVLIIVLLEIKPKLRKLEARITSQDINAAVLLLAMTFLVLPILPNRMLGPYHLFNPYKTWLMSVVISAVSFVGYAAIKVFGHKRGLFLTGALGGMVSSTAVTVSLSKIAAEKRQLAVHVAGAIAIACTIMFLRVLVLIFIVYPGLAERAMIPFIGASVAGFAFTYYLFQKSPPAALSVSDTFTKNPLQLSEAIKFGILFGIIYGASSFVQARYGSAGVYVVSFFSGLTDVDAITLSLAELSKQGSLGALVAMIGIIIASVVNSFVKLAIAIWQGGRPLAVYLSAYFFLTLGVLAVSIWFAGV